MLMAAWHGDGGREEIPKKSPWGSRAKPTSWSCQHLLGALRLLLHMVPPSLALALPSQLLGAFPTSKPSCSLLKPVAWGKGLTCAGLQFSYAE